MKISILTVELQQAIKKLNTVSQTGNEFPGILLVTKDNHLIVKKSNGTSQIKITLEADIIEDGTLFIPINTIKLIEKLKNVTFLEINNECIQADKKKIKFNPMDITNYYKMEIDPVLEAFMVSEKELSRLLTVKYAMAKDQTRPILNGINIDNNIFCGMDGYTVSLRESKEFKSTLKTTISNETVKILDKLISKKSESIIKVLYFEEANEFIKTTTYIKFILGDMEILSRVLEGEYINYKSIIPEDHTTSIELNVNKLYENMEFIKNIKIASSIVTKFNINEVNNICTVSGSTSQNTIEDELSCNVTGNDLLIGFNAEYMLRVLKEYKDQDITMNFTSAVNPCIIRPYDKFGYGTNNYNLDLVLPVRIKAVESNVA